MLDYLELKWKKKEQKRQVEKQKRVTEELEQEALRKYLSSKQHEQKQQDQPMKTVLQRYVCVSTGM